MNDYVTLASLVVLPSCRAPAEVACPPFLYGLATAGDDETVRRDVVRHDRARAHERTAPDRDGSDERRIRADESAVADHGPVLTEAVVVARDGPRSDVHVRADAGIAEIGEVAHLGTGSDLHVLDFDEVADLHVGS